MFRIARRKGVDSAEVIIQVVAENEIDLDKLRGQAYDNGSNMAAKFKGVQAIILGKNNQALFAP